jgi:hypothetical protein
LGDKRRVEALFKALSTDFLLREQFVTDPAQILNEYVSGKRLKPDEAAAANHLLYAVVSNPKLLAWLQSYARSNAEVPTGDDFTRDFAKALTRDGDEQTLIAVMRGGNEKKDLFRVQVDVLRGLISALQRTGGSVFAGTEMSSPGTEMSSPVTERSLAGTEMSSPGTEMSSPVTERSLGGGEVFGRPDVFAGTEQSSPGTEISPGHGTNISPGDFGGLDIDVTLRALVDFATQLRQSGALNVVRFQ